MSKDIKVSYKDFEYIVKLTQDKDESCTIYNDDVDSDIMSYKKLIKSLNNLCSVSNTLNDLVLEISDDTIDFGWDFWRPITIYKVMAELGFTKTNSKILKIKEVIKWTDIDVDDYENGVQ